VATIVQREYVKETVGDDIDSALKKFLAEGHYRDVTDPKQLATRLTSDLYSISHDKHLWVTTRSDTPPETGPADREESGRHSNFGVQRAEILAGNVGYLKVTSFHRRNEGEEAMCAALRVLANADALILDLRENVGGSPDTAILLMSHVLDQPNLPLFEISSRSGSTVTYKTEQDPVRARNPDRPVYVLISAHTWSAGEGVAFLLQERHRAEVVGETSVGAANPGRPHEVNALFEVNIPNGIVRSAVRGGNWEGTGVVPDVKVRADDALRAAQSLALRRLLALSPATPWRGEIETELRALGEAREQ
jgi:retinol-binding protein 3